MENSQSPHKSSGCRRYYSKTFFWCSLALLFVLALLVRIYQIDARPLHSDEAVNWHFLKKIRESGVFYYSFKNYHGPLYFWLSYFSASAFDFSVLGLRLVSILSGALLIPLLLSCRDIAGRAFILIASLLIALSSSLVFFSRYGIHESLLLLLTLSFAICIYRMFEFEDSRQIYIAWFLFALLVATKETYTVLAANLTLAFIVIPGLPGRIRFLMRNTDHIIRGFFGFTILLFFIFTSAFQHFNGIRELLLGTFQWIGRGTKQDVGHFKPFLYYLEKPIAIAEYELLITYAGLALFGIYYLGKKIIRNSSLQQEKFAVFLGAWSLSSLLSYSLIPYKTVWLVINITLPMILYCSCVISRIWGTNAAGKSGMCTLLAAYIAIASHNLVFFNYKSISIPGTDYTFSTTIPYSKGNPFSYVHTSPGMMEFIADMQKYWEARPEASVLIGTKSYWPLPYYLREKSKQLRYNSAGDFNRYINEVDVITIDHRKSWSPPPGWHKKYYRFSDVTEAYVYFRHAIPEK